jgi:hypothetical protein
MKKKEKLKEIEISNCFCGGIGAFPLGIPFKVHRALQIPERHVTLLLMIGYHKKHRNPMQNPNQ